ncbi:MAG: SPOR domain-containing protein [Caulobacteraceae bacterium]|nr:SPOR domain-containing protein [Caulobacteraceae bacterium]
MTTFAAIRQWLARETDLAPNQLVLLSAEAGFAFVGPPVRHADGLIIRRVREEVINQDLADSLGGRSATLALEFNCRHAETTVTEVRLYPGNGLGGGASKPIPPSRWLRANTNLDLSDLAQAACGKDYQPASSHPVDQAYSSPPQPTAQPAPRSAPRQAPQPALRPPAAEAGPGARWVQIGAFASIAIAEDRWRALQAALPAQTTGRSERTEPVPHGAGVLHRTLVGPFQDKAQAQAFCEVLKSRGYDCLVR